MIILIVHEGKLRHRGYQMVADPAGVSILPDGHTVFSCGVRGIWWGGFW